jgi:hypothetical protein
MVVVATHDERLVPLADAVVQLGGSNGFGATDAGATANTAGWTAALAA